MNKRRNNVLAALARSRPARLDSGAAPRANWPTATQLIEAAELSEDDAARDLGPGEPEGWAWRRLRRSQWARWPRVPVKLLGAMTSAAVTAVVIVIAVVVGSVVLGTPHGQPTGTPSSSASGPRGASLVFRPLPLGPHWHGHVSYAVSYGVVYLSGIARVDHPGSQSGGHGSVAMLPRSARPAGSLDLVAIAGTDAGASTGAGSVQIAATGEIEVSGQQPGVVAVSLDGLSFPVGSP